MPATTPGSPPPRRRARATRLLTFAGGALAAVIAVAAWSTAFPASPPLTQAQVHDAIASALASVTPPPAFSETAWTRIAPSVVVIEATGVASSASPRPASSAGPSASAPAADPAPSPAGRSDALGSGVVIDDRGDIMTALHVVDGASSVTVTFSDGSTSPALVTESHPELDIAVLQASSVPSAAQPATLGNPGALRVGSEVYAVGSPFGLADSMSAGVVSALGRSFQAPNGRTLTGLIQIDAAVNPGNSGGPLVNRDGQVVGIIDALVNPTRQDVFVGVGLAVPIDTAGGAAGLPQY